jgi:hypothetical protein
VLKDLTCEELITWIDGHNIETLGKQTNKKGKFIKLIQHWLFVTCRWHVQLDVSGVRSVANSAEMSVLSAYSEPLLA